MLAVATGNPRQIERIFNRSKLADRPNHPDPAKRGKWRQRADYRSGTIMTAIAEVANGNGSATAAIPIRTETDLGNARRLVALRGQDLHYAALLSIITDRDIWEKRSYGTNTRLDRCYVRYHKYARFRPATIWYAEESKAAQAVDRLADQ